MLLQFADLTNEQRIEAFEIEMAALFIRNADRSRFGGLQATLKNDFLAGNNENPRTLDEAYT